jgi:FKBP-type peptidyl-prolyl cis-trans isomerase
MSHKLLLFILFISLSFSLMAQPSGYKPFNTKANGKSYTLYSKIHHHPKGSKKILYKDFITFHIQTSTAGGKVFKSTFDGAPTVKGISADDPKYANYGFIQNMLLELHIGDSASFAVRTEDLFRALSRPIPDYLEGEEYVFYTIKTLKKQIWGEVQNDIKQVVFDQRKKDEKIIAEYVAKNLPDAKKTYTGVWYKIDYQGEGDFAVENDVVAIDYEGRFLDGKLFGSADKDGRYLDFPVGRGFVIQGLDEAMLLLREGAKATFVIPSYLAYGEEGWGDLIPPDNPLIFEIEFIDILVHKIVIENKGSIKSEENAKAQEKGMTLDEYLLFVEKEMQKKRIKKIKFGGDG